jgi:hypothetical protein
MRRKNAKLLEMFFYFAKKLRMGKPDGKLLEMLLEQRVHMYPILVYG